MPVFLRNVIFSPPPSYILKSTSLLSYIKAGSGGQFNVIIQYHAKIFVLEEGSIGSPSIYKFML